MHSLKNFFLHSCNFFFFFTLRIRFYSLIFSPPLAGTGGIAQVIWVPAVLRRGLWADHFGSNYPRRTLPGCIQRPGERSHSSVVRAPARTIFSKGTSLSRCASRCHVPGIPGRAGTNHSEYPGLSYSAGFRGSRGLCSAALRFSRTDVVRLGEQRRIEKFQCCDVLFIFNLFF